MNHQLLKGHIPDNRFEQLPEIISKFECTTPLRMAHFLSQCHHESLGFTKTVENLNYGAERLLVIFPKYFTTQAKLASEPNKKLAADYHRQPEKIANVVYANRMGNGDTASGDGWKFRGRGDLQTTGKNNYTAFSAFAGIDAVNNPDLLAGQYSLVSAAYFFKENGLWPVCDQGGTPDVVKKVRKKVNGGEIGLADVIKHFNIFMQILK